MDGKDHMCKCDEGFDGYACQIARKSLISEFPTENSISFLSSCS